MYCRTSRLLLAILVAGSGIAPPGYRHTLARGREPHQHAVVAAEHHGHTHSHPGARRGHSHSIASRQLPHRSPSDPQAEGISEFEAHMHVWCFGFELSFPLPTLPREDDRSTAQAAIWSAGQTAVCPATGLRDFLASLAEPLTVGVYAAEVLVPGVVRCAPDPPLTAPLCDNARGERSGVQVI